LNILLVRLRLIGDVVFTTPIVRALRRHHPGARLTYLVEPGAAAVVRGNPHLDEVIVLPKSRGWARLRDDLAAARDLRARRFDLVVDLHGGPRSAWLTWATGAPRRIGYAMAGRSWMYTDTVARAPDLRPRHSVRNQWDLLEPLGIGEPDPGTDPVEMAEDTGAAARVEAWLRHAGIGADHRIVVVHVSAGNPFRRWPAESFIALATALASADPARRVLLTSGPSELQAAAAIARDAQRRLGPATPAIVSVDFDMPELRSLIARAAVYIGGDSGPAHVASTTGTPIVQILGPTLPERSRPWRDARWFSETIDVGPLPCRPCHQRHCVPGDFRCLTTIGADRVAAAAERALRRESGGQFTDPSD
jgi:ADP-heptose:LPS heptosyltransferase